MFFLLYLLVLSPIALLRAYPIFEQVSSTPNYSFLPVAPLIEGNGLGGDRKPQEYPNVVASANEHMPSGADAPNNLISFYGADSDLITPSEPAQSHGECSDSWPNKLCCDDGVGTGQHQEELRTNCEICMLPPAFYVVRHHWSWLDAYLVGASATCNNSGNIVCCTKFWVGLYPNKRLIPYFYHHFWHKLAWVDGFGSWPIDTVGYPWNRLGREWGECWPVLSKLLPIVIDSARLN